MPGETDPLLKLYVGHKLTGASERFLTQMDLMVKALERGLAGKFEILKFLGLTGGTSYDVFQQDIKVNVATCNLFVAIVDEDSSGLGFEIAAALFLFGAPILIIQHRSRHVSRLILGAVEHHSGNMRHVIIDDDVVDVTPVVLEAVSWFGLHDRRLIRQRPSHHGSVGNWPFETFRDPPLSIDPPGA